jgi:glycosyltransferase involved in cell wall biosynthesis
MSVIQLSAQSGKKLTDRQSLVAVSSQARAASSGEVTVSLIIPTLNEAKNLDHVLPAIPDLVDEVVVVDGGSTDGTLDVVRELRPDAVIVLEPRPGKGMALEAGFAVATGDILVIMDADGSMDPLDIVTFVAALNAGADVAKGSRFLQGGGSSDLTLIRTLGNHALTQVVRWTFGGRYSDLCYGYMAFWRHVLPTFDGGAVGFEVETFLNVRTLAAGLRVVEVASFESARIHGESHLRTFRDGTRVLRTIARERRRLRRARSGLGVPRPIARTINVTVGAQDANRPGLYVSPSADALRHEAEQS